MRIEYLIKLSLIIAGFCIQFECLSSDLTWEVFKSNKKGSVDVYYRSTKPFLIVRNDKTLSGLEFDMLIGFQRFLSHRYGYELQFNWIEKKSFRDIYNHISKQSDLGDFGLDIISHTEQRSEEVQLSFPYFPDIQVLISHRSTPTVESMEKFAIFFDDYVAFSTHQTTYDINLKRIKKQYQMNFEIEYLESSNDIIDQIINTPNSFGYVDLISYLLSLNNNKLLKRQNILSEKSPGYCLIFNKDSDWHIPFNQFLISPEFELIKNKCIQKYLGDDVDKLIKNVSNGENEEIVLLQKEKNFINQELSEKEREAQNSTFIRNVLIIGLFLLIVITYMFFNSNRAKARANEILMKHREKIEYQNSLLSRHNEELVLKDEEKNNFIHILSHDLRSPINNISGLASLLKIDDKELNPEQLKMIDHIATESKRLNKMVTKILDIEKIESKTPEEFSEIKLKGILDQVIDNYESQSTSKEIVLEKNIEGDLVVFGDEEYLFHVFENLMSNAIKFSPQNKKVFVEAMATDAFVEIKITDEGPGMTEQDQQNMFKKFQVLSAKATAGERSTGLGLSIVDKYIGLLGGELICKSEKGKGTTFIVKLSISKQ